MTRTVERPGAGPGGLSVEGSVELRLEVVVDPATAFRALAALTAPGDLAATGAFWLDGGPEGTSRIGVGTVVPTPAPVLPALRHQVDALRRAPRPGGVPAIGLVGWLGYDLGVETVGLEVRREGGPSTRLLRVEEVLVVEPDGSARLLLAAAVPAAERARRREAMTTVLRRGAAPSSRPPWREREDDVRWQDSDDEYLSKIRRCQQHIAAGDAYQLCLTTAVRISTDADPVDLYLRLRVTNGTPRSGLLRIGGTWLLSTSPERFLSVEESGVVTTSPIKGTRPRSADPEEDRRLADELRTSAKERAENVMIVDLMRNDLSRVCRPETVAVTRLLDVQAFKQVHQLVSTVRGVLEQGLDAVDALAACFPAGSMTGAPKRRAMEILDRLEGEPRGLYAGAFGWFAASGAAELTMTIRSVVYADGTAAIGAGGGITASSVPEEELAEVHLKARALVEAVRGADR